MVYSCVEDGYVRPLYFQNISYEASSFLGKHRGLHHYLKAAVEISQGQREFTDNAHALCVANLTDATKVPREVASEMFEQS